MKGAVLIIGSLLWQDGSTNEPWDDVRKNWRETYLEKKRIKVKAPIRYGRYSSSNAIPVQVENPITKEIVIHSNIKERKDKSLYLDEGNFRNELYTMVLSTDYDEPSKIGDAFIFPLKNDVSNIEDVKVNVKALAKAEGIYIDENTYFRKSWGGVSIWINNNCQWKHELHTLWEEKLGNVKWLSQFKGFDSRGSILKDDGTVNITKFTANNPTEQSNLDEFDFILCAVTVPRNKNMDLKKYPEPSEIGKLAKIDIRRYFQNNHSNGIITSEDNDISKII